MDVAVSTVPQALPAYVQCSSGHPLCGLFVILRPQPGNASIIAEIFGDPENVFALCIVDQGGHLRVVTDADPWPEFYEGHNPNAAKVQPNVSYECYFIRDPSVERARAALDELNSGRPGLLTARWVAAVKPFALQSRTTASGTIQELVLTLEEDPTTYYPRGSARYGAWMLYRDMPNANCQPVRQQVEKLQNDLGAIRYVIGGAENPYLADPSKETANSGVFDSRTLNAVYAFQSDCNAGSAFSVKDGPPVMAKAGGAGSDQSDCDASLQYVQGSPAKTPGLGALRADAVADAATGDAIGTWYAQGLRNPHSVLVSVLARDGVNGWRTWLRPEAAEGLYVWRELTKALGFPRSIQASHTYRTVVTDVGTAAFGRSATSIHKTGLAVDLALFSAGQGADYSKPRADWPILYTQDARTPGKGGFKIRWRLFGISTLPFDKDGLEQCARNLEDLGSHGTQTPGELGDLEREIFKDALKTASVELLKHLREDPKAFLASYFRGAVRQWQYDAWDPEGGKPGALLTPSNGGAANWNEAIEAETAKALRQKEAAEATIARLAEVPDNQRSKGWNKQNRQAVAKLEKANKKLEAKEEERNAVNGATLFLDLTALAEVAGLHPITSWVNRDNPTGQDWGVAGKQFSTSKLADLAKALVSIKGQHGTLQIDTGTTKIAIDDLDTDFMTGWSAKAASLKRCAVRLPQVSCNVSADKKGKQRVSEFCGALDDFSEKMWKRAECNELKTGADWAKQIRDKLNEIESEAPVRKADGSRASTRKDPKEWTFTLLPAFGKGADGEQAVFLPRQSVYVPAPGNPIALEWWHFQMDSIIRPGGDWKSFAELLVELGGTRDTASGERLPELHYRSGLGYPVTVLDRYAG